MADHAGLLRFVVRKFGISVVVDCYGQDARMMLASAIAVFTSRALLVMLFLPFSAMDKILNFRLAVRQAEQAVPCSGLAKIMVIAGLGIEVMMSSAILTGVADRMAALVLAVYCIVTALLWKQFWKARDFRLQGNSRGRDTFWDFLKNLALAGGFLALALGPTSNGLRSFLARPLASSHPYALSSRAGA